MTNHFTLPQQASQTGEWWNGQKEARVHAHTTVAACQKTVTTRPSNATAGLLAHAASMLPRTRVKESLVCGMAADVSQNSMRDAGEDEF